MEITTNMNYGWTCPKCGRTYSPFTQMCYYCNNVQTIPVVNTEGTVNWKYNVNPAEAAQKNTGDFPTEPTMQDILHEEGYPTQPMGAL